MDAGFPNEKTLGGLERRQTPHLARAKNNPVLDKVAEPFLRRPPRRRPIEPRTWLYEMTYRAKSWSRERHMVLVVLELLLNAWAYAAMHICRTLLARAGASSTFASGS
jgi:hypothetical protein